MAAADRDDLVYWLTLSRIPGLGVTGFNKLLLAFGEPRAVFSASASALRAHVPSAVADEIRHGPRHAAAEPVFSWLAQSGNALITLADQDYPTALLQIADPPPLLYLKGRRELLGQPAMAVVGSRHGTPQGLLDAHAFAAVLSDSGLCIVSGLALGIDAAAHCGGLAGASGTIAIVGTGLDIVYPRANHRLAHDIANHGLLISEFPLGTAAKSGNFPRRNRLISGLSLGCLIIEAAQRSGSLITARLAAEQGREVFALPGSIHSPLAKGCHALIKQGAKLVECAQDILDEISWQTAAIVPQKTNHHEPPPTASPEREQLLSAMGHAPCDISTLAARSGLTSEVVCAILLGMELGGEVAALPGGLYQCVIH